MSQGPTLTGASAESGDWKRRPPVMILPFRTQEAVYRRYWARCRLAAVHGGGTRCRPSRACGVGANGHTPPERVEDARETLARADGILVAGSSLMVYSGFRFVQLAHDLGLPIAIVNRGRTRGDDLTALKVEGDVGAVLSAAISG